MNLNDLALPFPSEDIEFRVQSAGMGNKGVWCKVIPYVTVRACQSRLDEALGPENWKLEEPKVLQIDGKSAFACGLSIRIDSEWVTKWDVSSPTNIEPAKGGWSSAVKRAASCWGLARYLFHLDEAWAEVAETDPAVRGWHWARLPEEKGGQVYYWKTPVLPGWSLPSEEETEVSASELNDLKRAWKTKFAPDSQNRADLVEGFSRFVASLCGQFPAAGPNCWTRDALSKCMARINATTDSGGGVSADVPFEE